MPLTTNQIMIQTVDSHLSVIALVGNEMPQITGGFGGWQIIDRPRRTGVTHYRGRQPFHMTLPLLFDGWGTKRSQERNLRVLTWMALPPTNQKEPTPVRLYGWLPFPHGGDWVINGIEYGDQVMWHKGQRYRQDVTVALIHHNVPDKITFEDAGEGLVASHPQRTIKTVQGDTLKKLATKHLGDYRRWKDILDYNPLLRDPSNLPVGINIVIPPK